MRLFAFKIPFIFAFSSILFAISCGDEEDISAENCNDLAVFEETAGLLVMEAEDFNEADSINEWTVRTNPVNGISGHSGSAYLFYDGEDSFRDADKSTLTYNLKVNTPGVYRFLFTVAIGIGDNSTEHNDAFVKLPDASAFYGYRSADNTIVIPNDDGVDQSNPDPSDPVLQEAYPGARYKTPEGSNRRNAGFFKVYSNRLSDWWYEGSTSDNDAHRVYARFDSPGTYTLLISGRSRGFAIDRIVLYQEQGDFENLSNANRRKAAFDTLTSVSAVCL